MPKFKVTHYKDVLYKADTIVEAKDRQTAESIAYDIPMDKYHELDWKDAEAEIEPLWEAMQAEEITE